MDTLYERRPEVIKRLCLDAPGLLFFLMDGLIWRSSTKEKGMRRVNYYVKHLLVDAHGGFSKTIEWVTETKDPKLVCHPVFSLVTGMVWGRIAMRSITTGVSTTTGISTTTGNTSSTPPSPHRQQHHRGTQLSSSSIPRLASRPTN